METAVKESKFAKMTKEQLIQYGAETLAVTVDGSLTKEKMIEGFEKTEKAQRKAATEQTATSAKKAAKPDDPLVEVTFTNVEFPKAELAFTYEGHKYHLFDGQKYKLPISVITHLNNLKIPDDQYEIDAATGQTRGVRKGVRHRFQLVPTDLHKLMGIKKKGQPK